MTYYHGRSKSRPYYGSHIYITSSLEYASLYSDEGFVYECELLISPSELFSIKNERHRELLNKQISQQIMDKFNLQEEIDWAQLSYLCNENFEEPQDLLKHLGFKGVFLKERTNADSLYIFNQEDVLLGKKVAT